jgi:hypothetical protein
VGFTFDNDVVAGTVLVRDAIQSQDFAAGSAGWIIRSDGSAEFSDVALRGLTPGDIVVIGPAGKPQIILGTDASSGFIKFPTYDAIENKIAEILGGIYDPGGANDAPYLKLEGPSSTAGSGRVRARLFSGGAGAIPIIQFQKVTDAEVESTLATFGELGHSVERDFAVQDPGIFSAANIEVGITSITPVANVPTSKTISIGPLTGTNFFAQVTAHTSVPGTTVLGVGYDSESSTSIRLWLTRTNNTPTNLSYMVWGV